MSQFQQIDQIDQTIEFCYSLKKINQNEDSQLSREKLIISKSENVQSNDILENLQIENKLIETIIEQRNINTNLNLLTDLTKCKQNRRKKIDNNIQKIEDKTKNENYRLLLLFKSKQSNVKLSYNPQIKQLTTIKENLSKDNLSENEIEKLIKLKGSNVTFDLISKNNNQFEQIAGYQNLLAFQQKSQSKSYFDLYFLILLDKLNKMHKLGIAHSDIKPQNIVISYDFEPFFIDFGGSIFLKDYEDYLKYRTKQYNLVIYIKKYKFSNEEEVKLCDKTQVAITFLFLMCSKKIEFLLFNQKKFQELIFNLLKRTQLINRKIVLHIINQILNEADPTIKIVEQIKFEQIFTINNAFFQSINDFSKDIYYTGHYNYKQKRFIVKTINESSIQLLYQMNKLNFKNISILASELKITPFPEMEEYNYLSSQYRLIPEYYSSLLNFKKLKLHDLDNLCEYIKKMKNIKCNISIENKKNCTKLFESILSAKYIDTIELNFQFEYDFFNSFSLLLNQYLPNYYIKSLKFYFKKIQCKISKVTTNQKQQLDLQFQYTCPYYDQFNFVKEYKQIQNKYIVDKLKIIFDSSLCIDGEFFEKTERFLQYSKLFIELIKQDNKNNVCIEINREIDSQDCYFEQFNQSLNQKAINCEEVNKLNELFRREESFQSCKEDSVIYNVNKIESEQGINQICKFLKNTDKIQIPFSKIILKFFNFLFLDTKFWKMLKIIIEKKIYKKIEVILVNCQFNRSVVKFFKDIRERKFPVEFQFQDEFIFEDELIKFSNKIYYQIAYEDKLQFSIQEILRIQFFQQCEITKQKQNNEDNSQYNTKNIQIGIEQNKELINNDEFQNVLKNNFQKDTYFKEFKIEDVKYCNQLKIRSINYESNQINNKEDVLKIIDQIKNSTFFQNIKVKINKNKFDFQIDYDYDKGYNFLIKEFSEYTQNVQYLDKNDEINPVIFFECDCDNNEKEVLNIFQQLQVALVNKFPKILINNNLITINQIIIQTKNYSSHVLRQIIIIQNTQNFNNYDINNLENVNQKQIDIQSLQIKSIIYYFREFEQNESIRNILLLNKLRQNKVKYEQNKAKYDIQDQILRGQLMDNLENFEENYSLINLERSIYYYEQNNVVIKFILKDHKLGDQAFIEFFKRVEKSFKFNNQFYNLSRCDLTKKTLYNIYDILIKKNLNKKEQQDYNQLIIIFHSLNQNKTINFFQFEICAGPFPDLQYAGVFQFIKNLFQEIMEIDEQKIEDDYEKQETFIKLILKPKQQQSSQIKSLTLIIFEFFFREEQFKQSEIEEINIKMDTGFNQYGCLNKISLDKDFCYEYEDDNESDLKFKNKRTDDIVESIFRKKFDKDQKYDSNIFNFNEKLKQLTNNENQKRNQNLRDFYQESYGLLSKRELDKINENIEKSKQYQQKRKSKGYSFYKERKSIKFENLLDSLCIKEIIDTDNLQSN